jgi:hypothetical protein
LLAQLEKKPDAMWKSGTFWTFRNEAKVYGSPMFDSAWADCNGLAIDPLPQVIAQLRSAPVPSNATSSPAPGPSSSSPHAAQGDLLQAVADTHGDDRSEPVSDSPVVPAAAYLAGT